MSNFEKVEVMA